jgi:Tol biopolymer transport system component
MIRPHLVFAASCTIVLLGQMARAYAAPGDTDLVSVTTSGLAAGGVSVNVLNVSVSGDGRYVAFSSDAPNLVAGDTNASADVFVRDRQTGVTERVSVKTNGTQANGPSRGPAISPDGRFVAFESDATDLVPGDTNGQTDIFVRDRQTGVTSRVSVNANEVQADSFSSTASISADGRYVAFLSVASNLVPDDTNNSYDVFVRDRQAGTTERVSVTSSGVQGNYADFPVISGDGRYVAFATPASFAPHGTGSSDIYLHDRQTGVTQRISKVCRRGENSYWPALSFDGRFVAYASNCANQVPNDTNDTYDVFVWDRQTGAIERVSVDSSGAQAGLFGQSSVPAISADGRYVAFGSLARDLVPDNSGVYTASDVFVHDRQTGITEIVSVDSNGMRVSQPGGAFQSAISADGRFVAFSSDGRFVAADHNDVLDAYIHERANPLPPGAFALTPDAVDFGKQARDVGSPTRTVHVTNTSSTSLPINSIQLGGQNPLQFLLASHCGSSLAAGASCAIDIVFKPTSAGVKTASLNVSMGSGAGSKSVRLSGEGVTTQFTLSPTSLNLGSKAVGTPVTYRRRLLLTNLSAAPLPILSIKFSGNNPTQFGVSSQDCGTSVWPNGNCTLYVSFKPTSVGVKTAVLNVTIGGGAPPQPVSVTGTGT